MKAARDRSYPLVEFGRYSALLDHEISARMFPSLGYRANFGPTNETL